MGTSKQISSTNATTAPTWPSPMDPCTFLHTRHSRNSPRRMSFMMKTRYVVVERDTDSSDFLQEVPCKTHIGSIRNQGKYKYKNTRFSGVVASACDHALPAGLVDMIIGEAYV